MNSLLLATNIILMVTIPFAIGWIIAKRHDRSWELFVIGAVTFIGSQIVHLPFNTIILTRLSDISGELSEANYTIVLGVILGLSAGVFEELARYITYRLLSTDHRDWSAALMLGIGHGGIEAVILGLVAGANILILFGYREGLFQTLITAEQGPLALSTIDGLLSGPWYDLILGALERVFAIAIHLALSIIVVQVFRQNNKRWLLAAIFWHAVVDGLVVISVSRWGVYVTESILAAFAILSIAIVFYFRESKPIILALKPLKKTGPATFIAVEITEEQLEKSRFM